MLQHLIPAMASKLAKLKSVENSRVEASVLLSVALETSREEVVMNYKRVLTDTEMKKVEEVLKRRLEEMPVAYLAGQKDFYGRSFFVSRDTLIPRPATETLINETIALADQYFDSASSNAPFNVLELGVGTGCVITTLIAELNDPLRHKTIANSAETTKESVQWLGTGVDLSSGALKIANQNAAAHSVGHLINFYESNWTKDLVETHGVTTKYDIVVSNPPYLTEYDWETAPETMTKYEPSLAFVAGPDGLDCYRRIFELVPTVLEPGALVCLEIGAWQEEGVRNVFDASGAFKFIKNARDMDGHMRCLIFKYKGRHPRTKSSEEAIKMNEKL